MKAQHSRLSDQLLAQIGPLRLLDENPATIGLEAAWQAIHHAVVIVWQNEDFDAAERAYQRATTEVYLYIRSCNRPCVST